MLMAQGSRDREHSCTYRVPTALGGQFPHCPMAEDMDSGHREAAEHAPRVPVTLLPQVEEKDGRWARRGDNQESRGREVGGCGDR